MSSTSTTSDGGIQPDDPRLIWVPEPYDLGKGGLTMNYPDYYWIHHPEKGVAFWSPTGRLNTYMHPQANKDKVVVETIRERMYPWAEVKQIAKVTVPA